MDNKGYTLAELFTEGELAEASQLRTASEILEKVVRPAAPRIEKLVGVKFDQRQVAELLENLFQKTREFHEQAEQLLNLEDRKRGESNE